jgi:hypothetical protein
VKGWKVIDDAVQSESSGSPAANPVAIRQPSGDPPQIKRTDGPEADRIVWMVAERVDHVSFLTSAPNVTDKHVADLRSMIAEVLKGLDPPVQFDPAG